MDQTRILMDTGQICFHCAMTATPKRYILYVMVFAKELSDFFLVVSCCFVLFEGCFHYCSFVVWSEAREHDSSSSVLLSQDCFGY